MKKLISIMIMLAVLSNICWAAEPQWVKLGDSTNGGIMYIDMNNITKSKNDKKEIIYTVWLKFHGPNNIPQIKEKFILNYSTKQYASSSWQFYDKDGIPEELYHSPKLRFKDIEPGNWHDSALTKIRDNENWFAKLIE